MTMSKIEKNVQAINALFPGDFPKTALVLGSGLGQFCETLEQDGVISYTDIPHFPQPTVEGHAGRMVVGKTSGFALWGNGFTGKYRQKGYRCGYRSIDSRSFGYAAT